MSEDRGFEPFIDWDAITDDIADELHKSLVEFRQAQDDFIADRSKENASSLLRLQHELSMTVEAIHRTFFTVPMMVHVAGARVSSTDDDGHDQIIQRCIRCGSILQFWTEEYRAVVDNRFVSVDPDDLPWWNENDVVAKGSDKHSMTMYGITDRDLDQYERPCPDLAKELGD